MELNKIIEDLREGDIELKSALYELQEMDWQPIKTLTKEHGEVLLKWEYKEAKPIYRIGVLVFDHGVLDYIQIRCTMDFGDFYASGYNNRDDQPTAWKRIT